MTNTLAPSETPEPTITTTPAGPFVYIVEENDNCTSISIKFAVDLLFLIQLNNLTDQCIIRVGDEMLIPPPGATTSTPTALPEFLSPGTRIMYTVLQLDSLITIASKFNSTVEAIKDIDANAEIIGENDEIFPGQVLTIPVNIATPTPTRTPGVSGTLTQQAAPQATTTSSP